MRTLTEVFAPGAPTLPEGLRTLVVSPERELEPGMTVRAAFTFRNQGGAPATGVRVRFNVPEGLVYLVGSGLLDGTLLDDEQGNSPLLARSGAQIGEVAPGEERRIELAYSVAGAIENGSTVELQAAVAAFELPPVGSNVVRLVARSKPALENALTNVGIESAQHARPAGEAVVTVRIHNAGESSAHDVVVVSPVPQHTTYVPNSAHVNGREFERELGRSFERAYAPVVVKNLPASATATLTYRVRIDDPLPDGTAIVARAQIASQETAAFTLEPAALVVRSAPDFSGEETQCTIEPAPEVRPGGRVTIRVRAVNSGTMAAEDVSLALALPEGLPAVRAAASLDGRPLRDRKKDAPVIDLGRIEAGACAEFVAEAVVASPAPDGSVLPVSITLRWPGGERLFERSLAVRSEPCFGPRRNGIERANEALVTPGGECEAIVRIANDGSAAATDAVLQLHLDPAFEDVRAYERNAKLVLEGEGPAERRDSLVLGRIEPYSARRIIVRARVRSPYPDRSELRLGATLHAHETGETPLGQAAWRVDSHAAFSPEHSRLMVSGGEALRPNQLADVFVRLRNEGTDVAHNVALRLYVSAEARLEAVDGATRERSALLFGDVAPGAAVEARLGLRLLRSLAKEFPVTIDAVLTADELLPVQLDRLTIATTAEPDFSVGTFRSDPPDVCDVGEMVEYVLHVRNGGDGPARRVQIRVDPLDSLIYVPNSTSVNEVPVRDVGAVAPFANERGIVLNDVDPGIEATIRWREVVHNGLRAGEAIVRVAGVRYDGERVDEIVSNELKIRSAPAFANAIAGLPFGLDGVAGPAFGRGGRALPAAEQFVELPAATPVVREAAAPLEAPAAFLQLASYATNGRTNALSQESGAATLSSFAPERLARTLRLLEETRFGTLVGHLFAIRALLPERVGESDLFARLRDELHDVLDRLFIKLRLPNYALAPRDLETAVSRAELERALERLPAVRGEPAEPPEAIVVLRGRLEAGAAGELLERLRSAPEGSALAWLVLASSIPGERPELRNYRDALASALDELAPLDPPGFAQAAQRRPYPVLDAALDVVRASLAVAGARR